METTVVIYGIVVSGAVFLDAYRPNTTRHDGSTVNWDDPRYNDYIRSYKQYEIGQMSIIPMPESLIKFVSEQPFHLPDYFEMILGIHYKSDSPLLGAWVDRAKKDYASGMDELSFLPDYVRSTKPQFIVFNRTDKDADHRLGIVPEEHNDEYLYMLSR
jgi:hypothetical protein